MTNNLSIYDQIGSLASQANEPKYWQKLKENNRQLKNPFYIVQIHKLEDWAQHASWTIVTYCWYLTMLFDIEIDVTC